MEEIDLQTFFKFLSFPSVSTDPAYAKDVKACADWLKGYVETLGFRVELWETKKHPILFAEAPYQEGKPTLLIYNHYDVQPVDPLELWKTPPFEPKQQEGNIYARGAQDNKGQCFYVLEALKHFKGKFPLNIKLIIEGEEECGSKSLDQILNQKAKELKADYVAIVDLGIPAPDAPAVTLGTRGLVTMDLIVEASSHDLHSGSHGGIAYNPIHALTKILASVRNEKGEISIPQFYSDVKTFSDQERKHIDFNFDEKKYHENFGIPATGGEEGFTPSERLFLRPTLEINGISGGYSGEGFKTVIPAKASAKISCRLVPDQTPEKIGKLLKEYFESKAPKGTKVSLHIHPGGGHASRANPTSKGVIAFQKAFSDVFQKPCKFVLEGASIPIIPRLAAVSGAEPILVGLGLTTDCIHAPNEHFGIDRLVKGKNIMIKAIENLR